VLSTEGQVLQGMGVSKMPSRGEEEFCIVTVSSSGDELGKAMGSIWPTVHEGADSNRFGGDAREDIKGMSGNNVREVRDDSDAVPGIRSFVRGSVIGRGGMRKSRGRVRT
jgi:hypothetical protein